MPEGKRIENVRIIYQTPKAILVEIAILKRYWIPRSEVILFTPSGISDFGILEITKRWHDKARIGE